MGAGGSHPQAAMMPDPWATGSRPSASENQPVTSVPPETVVRALSNKETFAPTGGFRRARTRSDALTPLTRQQLENKKYEELQQRTREEKEEAWELFKRQPSLRPRTRAEFEEEFRRKVMSGVFSSSKEEQWRDLQKWMNELRQVAQEEERRLAESAGMGPDPRAANLKPVLQVVCREVITRLLLRHFSGAKEKTRRILTAT